MSVSLNNTCIYCRKYNFYKLFEESYAQNIFTVQLYESEFETLFEKLVDLVRIMKSVKKLSVK